MTPTVLSHLKPLNTVTGTPPVIDSAVRLRLDPVLGRRAAVDGAWWPRSRDAGAELPALIAAVDQRLGRITMRVGLHAEAWDNIPHRIPARGRQIRVGWFRHSDPHLISLVSMEAEPIMLLVIPSGTADGPAALALTLAAGPRPADILAAAHRSPAADLGTPDADGPSAWENEGGHFNDHLAAQPPTMSTRRLPTGCRSAGHSGQTGPAGIPVLLRMERS